MDVPYFQVPNSIYKQKIGALDKLVYIYLCRCGNESGSIYPSYATIASNCSISKRTAIKVIDNLILAGLIKKEYRRNNGDQDSNNYTVVYPEVLSNPSRLKTMPYKDYLNTPHWAKIRKYALIKAHYSCQLCNRTDNLNVHHRTYEHRGEEHASDVIVLCQACHEKFHDIGGAVNE